MRCARCGNENPEDNRFCGMCGATLLAAPTVGETQTQRAASASPIVPAPVTAPAAPSVPRQVEDRRGVQLRLCKILRRSAVRHFLD